MGGQARRVKVIRGKLEEWLPSLGVQVFRHKCDEPMALIDRHDQDNVVSNPSFETSHAYVSAPDGWDCRMAPMQIGASDSTCFADTHVAFEGRHSGRFATGINPYLFRVRPSLKSTRKVGVYEGSIWAQAEAPMELLAVRI